MENIMFHVKDSVLFFYTKVTLGYNSLIAYCIRRISIYKEATNGYKLKADLHDKPFEHGTPENGHLAKTPTSLFTRLHDNFLLAHFYDKHGAHRKTAPLLSVYDGIF